MYLSLSLSWLFLENTRRISLVGRKFFFVVKNSRVLHRPWCVSLYSYSHVLYYKPLYHKETPDFLITSRFWQFFFFCVPNQHYLMSFCFTFRIPVFGVRSTIWSLVFSSYTIRLIGILSCLRVIPVLCSLNRKLPLKRLSQWTCVSVSYLQRLPGDRLYMYINKRHLLRVR